MLKHRDRRAGEEDMRMMRYERMTVEVGRRPRTAFVVACCDSMGADTSGEEVCDADEVGRATLRCEL